MSGSSRCLLVFFLLGMVLLGAALAIERVLPTPPPPAEPSVSALFRPA